MVPPGDIFGIIPVWVGVYLALIATQALAGWLAYKRVFHLVLQGRSVARFDQPWKRFTGALSIVLGQRKVLQRVGTLDARSRNLDLAGLVRAELQQLGVTQVYDSGRCTYADKDLFYSWRRDGVTGRMASLIWME